MAVNGEDGRRRGKREEGKDASKHQSQQRVDAGRDGRTLSRNQILRRKRDREILSFPVQLTTSRVVNHSRLIHTLLNVLTVHAYIHPRRQGVKKQLNARDRRVYSST